MNYVSIENGFVKILYKLNKDLTHSIVDGRKMDLKRVCNKYPPLNSFSPISESIFMFNFKSVDDLYFLIHVYAEQYNIKIEAKRQDQASNMKITFKCHYSRYFVQVKLYPHNHPLIRLNNYKKINILTNEIKDLVESLVRNIKSSSPEIIKVVKENYNVSESVLKKIEYVIRRIKGEMRNEIDGLYNLYNIIKDKYTYYENKNALLVILDKRILYTYNTLLADGTFGVFLNNNQLYLVYSQISPKLILLVAFAITNKRDKDTYTFIYQHLNQYNNIKYIIHDHEAAVVYSLKSLGIKFVNDIYHLFIYIKDERIKKILYKFIKHPQCRDEILKNINENDQKYFNKEGVMEFGIFGCHSTSMLESYNNIIKNKLKKRRSREDTVLIAIEDIYQTQKRRIEETISIQNINKNTNDDILWPECNENLQKQLILLATENYEVYNNNNIYIINNTYTVTLNDNLLFCSCHYREFTGIPCSHMIYINIKYDMHKTLIANECFTSFYLDNKQKTDYYINFIYPKEIENITNTTEDDDDRSDDAVDDSVELCDKPINSNNITYTDSYKKILGIVQKIYKSTMLEDICQETIESVNDKLISSLRNELDNNSYMYFLQNKYNTLNHSIKIKTITYIYLLSSPATIINDTILNYINNEMTRRTIKIPPRVKSPSE